MSDQPRIVSIDITHLVRAALADLDPDDGRGPVPIPLTSTAIFSPDARIASAPHDYGR